jgi:hypothetical protein
MGIGFQSMESEDGVEFAERIEHAFDCPEGHTVVVPLSVEADVPTLWQCRCGVPALRRDADRPELMPGKRRRTHWDMLLERRSMTELEDLLDERLQLLRGGRARMAHSA